MASSDLRDELSCSICLDIFTDPVTLRCGNNFCRECIDHVLDTQGTSEEMFSCPECRKKFSVRPDLQRNVTLRNIAERFRSTQPEGNSVFFCTYCIHSPVPAVKSCLHCEALLCSDHLKVHSKSPQHVLSEPSTALNTRKCAVHRKILEYYCFEDSSLICVSCRLEGEHGGHHVESLDNACENKRRQLFQFLQQLTAKKSEIEKRFQSLEERKRSVHEKAASATEEITAMFGEIRRLLEDLEKNILREVSRQEKHESLLVSDLIRVLEIKKEKISRKMCHTEALCHMTDPMTVLQEQVSWRSDFCDHEKGPTGRSMDDEKSHEVEDLCMEPVSNTLHVLSDIVRSVSKGIYSLDPTDIILDVNTSGDYMSISQDLKTAAYSESKSNLPTSQERFQCNQILSTQSFSSGVHYWDVEGSELGMWRVGVCYPSIDRAGGNTVIGDNDRSWALEYFIDEYSAIYNGKEVSIPQDISHRRLRICLDYEAGQLSFYELSDPINHLHTFSTIFTEPLYAAFWVGWDTAYKDSWVKINNCQ